MARPQKWVYIGNFNRVTPCNFQDNPDKRIRVEFDDGCYDGSCPGQIDGTCPFHLGNPAQEWESLFEKVEKIFPITFARKFQRKKMRKM